MKDASEANIAIVAHALYLLSWRGYLAWKNQSKLAQLSLSEFIMFCRTNIDSSFRMECYGHSYHIMPGKYEWRRIMVSSLFRIENNNNKRPDVGDTANKYVTHDRNEERPHFCR